MDSLEDISKDSTHISLSKSPAKNLNIKDYPPFRTRHFSQTKRVEGILTHIAFSVGMGCVWRVPYLSHRNGGGSYLLVYFFMLLLLGVPLLYLEMVLGHWLDAGHLTIWKQLVPWMDGIGYTCLMVCFLVSVYNSIVVTWTFSYLFHSFKFPLPWDYCPLDKNQNISNIACLQSGSHQYFWYHTTLHASDQMEEGGHFLVLNLTLGIFTTWLLLFLILFYELRASIKKLALILAMPCIFLLCLLVRSSLLEGAVSGLQRMLRVELSAWASLDLWRQAGSHTLYSMGLGLGIVNLPFYKARGGNSLQVAMLVILSNTAASLLATAVVFTVLGFWVSSSGHACVKKSVSQLLRLIDSGALPPAAKPPDNILLQPPSGYLDWIRSLPGALSSQVIHRAPSCSVKAQDKVMEGTGLTFVAFSQVLSLFPASSVWAALFFLSLLALRLNTLMTILMGIVYPLQSSMSIFRQSHKLPLAIVCLIGFLCSLVFSSRAGGYIMSMFDDHLVALVLLAIVAIQNVTLAWIHGARRFRNQLFVQWGQLLWSFHTLLWCCVATPGLLALLMLCLLDLYQLPLKSYTAWNRTMGQEVIQLYQKSSQSWITFLTAMTFLPIPVFPICHSCCPGSLAPGSHSGKKKDRQDHWLHHKPVHWPKQRLSGGSDPKGPQTSHKFSLPLSHPLDLSSLSSRMSSRTYSWASLIPSFPGGSWASRKSASVTPYSAGRSSPMPWHTLARDREASRGRLPQ